jgi:hypothetical protein
VRASMNPRPLQIAKCLVLLVWRPAWMTAPYSVDLRERALALSDKIGTDCGQGREGGRKPKTSATKRSRRRAIRAKRKNIGAECRPAVSSTRGLCSKATSQTPDRSRASRQRKSRNKYWMRSKASSQRDPGPRDLSRCLRPVFPGVQSARCVVRKTQRLSRRHERK